MAERSFDLPYAELVKRQAAEDVARWRASEATLLWVAARIPNQAATDATALWRLMDALDGADASANAPSSKG